MDSDSPLFPAAASRLHSFPKKSSHVREREKCLYPASTTRLLHSLNVSSALIKWWSDHYHNCSFPADIQRYDLSFRCDRDSGLLRKSRTVIPVIYDNVNSGSRMTFIPLSPPRQFSYDDFLQIEPPSMFPCRKILLLGHYLNNGPF